MGRRAGCKELACFLFPGLTAGRKWIQCNYFMAVNRFTQNIRSKIIRIGNSQGIRIPHALLQQLHLDSDVEMSVQDDQLIIRAARSPREGWEALFSQALVERPAETEDEALLDETEWDGGGLKW